jgi:hypothetical protein
MSYSITNLKQELTGVLHGTQLSQITSLDQLIYRAARDVFMDCDPDESIRIIPITNAVFNSIYDYPCPADLKRNRVVDIRPQVNRKGTDKWLQWYNQSFDANKQSSYLNSFTIQWDNYIKTIRINAPSLVPPIQVNTCDSLTANGTWTAGGNASGLVEDNINYVSGAGSLQFNLSAVAGTGYLENSTMTAVDLSDWLNQGTWFLYVYLPTASSFSNINLRIGSGSGAYYSVNATTTQQGTTFENGWNLLQFNWLGASVTGVPDPTKINYVRVTYTYDGTAQTAVRLDQITAALGTILEIEYYSKYMFRDASTGAFQETVTDDSNLINLDTDSLNLMLYKTAYLAVQQQQGLDALGFDAQYFKAEYDSRLSRQWYLSKSQVTKVQGTYYAMPQKKNTNPVRRGF